MGFRVAVVGGGYAGMAAAASLSLQKIPVTVFEAGRVLGGRARRVRVGGHELDNGQHILTGAYAQLLRLMHVVGVPSEAVLRLPLELRYADGFALRELWLPAPLGLLGGLLSTRRIPLRERLGAIRFLSFLRNRSFRVPGQLSVHSLLEAHRQNGAIGRYLWRPICVAALNTPPEQACAQVFANVLRDSLGGPPGAADLMLPRVDLSKLFPEPAAEFVARHGGEVRLGTPVRDVSGLKNRFSRIVVAVGPHQLKSLLPGLAPDYAYQPIYTCTLQYPRPVKLRFPMLGLVDGIVQWAFDLGLLAGAKGRIACVISAQGDHQQLTHDELAARCHRELARALGHLPDPQWWRVIAEKRATIASTPGLARPRPQTPLAGVYLAGDYTDPEYPPTLEAAARSGVRAAEAILQTR
jgi:squalene-associated FAD-dependent desaturase